MRNWRRRRKILKKIGWRKKETEVRRGEKKRGGVVGEKWLKFHFYFFLSIIF
jgi:hypothetical protein